MVGSTQAVLTGSQSVRLAVVLAAHEVRQGGRAGLGAHVKERGCSLEGKGSH